ncbi:MAG: AMP-binding protein [Candidatus Gorgyraea atricola]|nr:AMP-binding protein [Candidatus Gorgyraea atricola]
MVEYSLIKNFDNSVEQFKDKVAILSGSTSLTYAELGEKIKNTACYISSLGIEKGDRVAIILDNGPEFASVFFALAYIGAVAVPLDPRMTEKDVANIMSDSGAKILLTIDKIKELDPPQVFEKAIVEPDDLIVLLYTSGTTDLPKGVMLTHKNLCSNFNSLRKMKIFTPKDTILSILPLYHSYSLMTTLIAPLFSGSKIVYVSSDWPEKLADYIKEAGTTVFIGVPQIYHMMHSRMIKKLSSIEGLKGLFVKSVIALGLTKVLLPKVKNAFGKRLRFFISGGAKLDATVARDFFKLGFKILEGYGLTETSPVASINPVKRPKIGSIGTPVPDVRMRILNPDSSGVGEIVIQGPNVMKGYYKNEEKTKEVLKNNWFYSGDLGYKNRDGYFYITGRSKEVIVLSSGKNIYPEEIEKHYSNTSYIKEMCVIGVLKGKGNSKLEYLHAIVVPDLEFFKERGEMNVNQVLKATFDNLSKDIPGYRHIMGFTVTKEALSRTVLGKLKRYEIEKKFLPVILEETEEEKAVSPEDQALLQSDTAKRLIACIKDALEIKGDAHLNDSIELDLGVDSLTRVELVLAVEKCFNIEISDEMIAAGIFTVKDILTKVEELLASDKRQVTSDKGVERAIHWAGILKQELAKDFQDKISLELSWIDYVFTFIIKGCVGLFFRIFYRLKVEGAEKIPKKGPYVLCVNHTSFLDGFIVLSGVPLRTELELFFIGFRRYFIVPIIRNLVRRSRIIPVDATQIIEAMQGSAYILKHNKALCIFPEGERSIDGEVKEFKKGIGIIAKELNAPLVPVYINGAFKAWPRTQKFPKLHPISIKFGSPVAPDVLAKKGDAKDEHEAIAAGIRGEVINLG